MQSQFGFGIRNTTQLGIRNPTNDWNPESPSPPTENGIQYLESTAWNPESKIALNSIT